MILLLAAVMVFSGCSGLPLREKPLTQSSESHGLLVISVKVKEGRFKTLRAREVRFRRAKSFGDIDDAELRSNFSAKGLVFLLDVPAGDYSPTAAATLDRGRWSELRFDPAVIKTASVELEKGAVVFAGDYEFQIQKTAFSSNAVFIKKSLEKDNEIAALTAASQALAKTQWQEIIERRLALLGTSKAPVRDIKEKIIPRKFMGTISYVDQLGWGEPRKIAGGLEWKEKKDRARLAMSFLTPGTKGYKSPEEYKRYFRDAGSTEDSHRLEETPFSGRTAFKARYTTYVYPEGTLVGSLSQIFVTEVFLVPMPTGVFLLIYRAQRKDFDVFYGQFEEFSSRVALP